jgi:hypothetical protein
MSIISGFRLCGLTAIFTLWLGGSVSAAIVGFNGPWAAFDAGGGLINGFSTYSTGEGAISGSISPDRSTMTVEFTYPSSHSASIFFQNYSALLPIGAVSWDWSFTTYQTGAVLLEDQSGTRLNTFSGPNTWTGSTTATYGGTYFSFGNINLGWSGADGDRATLVLTNFVGPGNIVPVPALTLPFALGVLALRRR